MNLLAIFTVVCLAIIQNEIFLIRPSSIVIATIKYIFKPIKFVIK